MTTINELNDECLRELFSLLTLQEKCAVQRVKRQWKRVIDDMIAGMDNLELVIKYSSHKSNIAGHPNAYYSKALEHFFETGVLNDAVKVFFGKFADEHETSESDFVISSIQHLVVNKDFKVKVEPEKEEESESEVPAKSLKLLLTIFTNLKSLAVDGVSFGDDKTDWSDVAKNVANLESFAVTSCGDFNRTALKSLVKNSKSLRVLKTNYLSSYQTEKLKNLEKLTCDVCYIGDLRELLKQHSKLAKISCRFAGGFSFHFHNLETLSKLFPSFLNLQSLKEVELKYDSYLFVSPKPISYSGPPLPHIRSLILRDVYLLVQNVQVLAQIMPSISKLALIGFGLQWSLNDTAANFLVSITTFLNLEDLFLEYTSKFEEKSGSNVNKSIHARVQRVEGYLADFFDVEKLPKLRRLACNCFDIGDCFEAFCELANVNPKQCYFFMETFNAFDGSHSMKIPDSIRKKQPRNVRFF